MKKEDNEKRNVVPFVNCFSHISVMDLEEILEWLKDNDYLSDRGKVFKNRLWSLFIKK